MTKTALVVGASGIVGSATASLLLERGWTVHGLARRPANIPGVNPVAADLQDADATATALRDLNADAVFITTWLRQNSEAANIRVNGAMVRNLLDGLPKPTGPRHVALVTGLKHYLEPSMLMERARRRRRRSVRNRVGSTSRTSIMRRRTRCSAAAARDGFTWSVHRPHTVLGLAVGNAMNMGTTLAVYATMCREKGRPFVLPGSPAQWSGLTDMTDARQLARHLLWAAETDGAHDEAFNVVNGDHLVGSGCGPAWPDGSASKPRRSTASCAAQAADLADDAIVWRRIAEREGLAEPDVDRLASPWHTDADLGRPIEVVTDMSKSRRLGFTDYQPTGRRLLHALRRLRAERLIP
ncbi:NAD-dependent epimerase/dehydratase family protein [Sphingomonas sp. MMS24-JH45]